MARDALEQPAGAGAGSLALWTAIGEQFAAAVRAQANGRKVFAAICTRLAARLLVLAALLRLKVSSINQTMSPRVRRERLTRRGTTHPSAMPSSPPPCSPQSTCPCSPAALAGVRMTLRRGRTQSSSSRVCVRRWPTVWIAGKTDPHCRQTTVLRSRSPISLRYFYRPARFANLT